MTFAENTEGVFNSNNDMWGTLNNIQFIDNVNKIYQMRKEYAESYKSDFYETAQLDYLIEKTRNLYKSQVNNCKGDVTINYKNMVRELMKNRFELNNFFYTFNNNITNRRVTIFKMRKLNDQNKRLMGITDEDIDAFIHINDKPVSDKLIAGTWSSEVTEGFSDGSEGFVQLSVTIFNKDHSFVRKGEFDNLLSSVRYGRDNHLMMKFELSGQWQIEADDVILSYDKKKVTCERKPQKNWTSEDEEKLKSNIEGLEKDSGNDTLRQVKVNVISNQMSFKNVDGSPATLTPR